VRALIFKLVKRKIIVGIAVGALAALISVTISILKPRQPRENTSSNGDITAQQAPKRIEGVKVPDGWYTHQTYGIDHAITVLSRTKDLPHSLTIEQIGISVMETSLVPEDFIPRQGAVGGNLTSPDAQWSWGIYQGHKTFSMTFIAGSVPQWFVYLFGGSKVYQFNLSPNDQTNPNLARNRTDFWKVITYYAQDPLFERLSREETQRNCRTIALPEGQAYSVQAEPETGYVVVDFTEDDKRKYAFLNYNDELSQCTPDIGRLLSRTKNKMEKVQTSE